MHLIAFRVYAIATPNPYSPFNHTIVAGLGFANETRGPRRRVSIECGPIGSILGIQTNYIILSGTATEAEFLEMSPHLSRVSWNSWNPMLIIQQKARMLAPFNGAAASVPKEKTLDAEVVEVYDSNGTPRRTTKKTKVR